MNRRANKPPSRKPASSHIDLAPEQEPVRIPHLTQQRLERREMYQGPVPPPDILERFEALVPGTAKVMLEQAAQESEHRRKLEEAATMANIDTQRRALDLDEKRSVAVARSDIFGQTAGVLVSIACISGAIYLAMNGHKETALALTVLPSAAVLQAFFAKRPAPPKEPPAPKK